MRRARRFLTTHAQPSRWSALIMVVTIGSAFAVLRSVVAPHTAWKTTVLGVGVKYVVTRPNTVFLGRMRNVSPALDCTVEIAIDPDFMQALGAKNYLAWISAHEIGHCLDARLLSSSHNHTAAKGPPLEAYGDTNLGRAETFGDAYALAYLKACGNRLAPLGWPQRDGTCTLPDPATVHWTEDPQPYLMNLMQSTKDESRFTGDSAVSRR
ncbi:hypothetical protein [Deinococcus soli (ex Cha et al. 2016)]|uniref:Uncharacterized protein n=2 Tax=Deinococcus soli (ex Cha et al. 2016) TaxID=1309411 RepID=A0AAE3XCQ3_9DEIO|nr:hypothetical protein [Deinococcus soli (ex Cha et al. 2016)]MDR6218483.1 hypothetical protein [Deinococcus soli (ex Cha et al. 2016)]MDR6329223.1 hypothetical protein [Deinococcus soli (ex Cha et al. 2016)]MDR6751496.1 hypothetical protein [Deinococcus soli (ex Cha et al. 2016)]